MKHPSHSDVVSARSFSWTILDHVETPERRQRDVPACRILESGGPALTPDEALALFLRINAGRDRQTGALDDDARAAVQSLVTANFDLCIEPARSRLWKGLDSDDVAQDALLGLHRAAMRFDATFEPGFSTYAKFWIIHSIAQGADRQTGLIRIPPQLRVLEHQIATAESRGSVGDGTTPDELAIAVAADVQQIRATLDARFTIIGFDDAEDEHRRSTDDDPREFEPDEEDAAPPDWLELILEVSRSSTLEELTAHVINIIHGLPALDREVLTLHYGLFGKEAETLEEIGHGFDLTRERIRQVRNKALEKVRRQLALDRARDPYLDDEIGLDRAGAAALDSEEIDRFVAVELGHLPPSMHPDNPAPRRPKPQTVRRRRVRRVLADVRAATDHWRISPFLEAETPDDVNDAAIQILPLLTVETLSRVELVEALSELTDEMDDELMKEALLACSRSTILAAAESGLPDEAELARVLRLARFAGCATDPLGYELVLRASPTKLIDLPRDARVVSSWHFEQDDPSDVRLMNKLHRNADRLGFEWNTSFDDFLDVVIAERLDHRSGKTFSAVIADVPVCDIDSFLAYEHGRPLKVLRSPQRIPWTYVCTGCHIVRSHARAIDSSRPSRCADCT